MKPRTVAEVCDLYSEVSDEFEKNGKQMIRYHEVHINTTRNLYKFRNTTRIIKGRNKEGDKIMSFYGCPEDPVTRDIGVCGTICIAEYSETHRKIEIVGGWIVYSEEA